ncbi:MAG: stage sporulation protein [Clostridiaceae bacterium]|jgi:stage II sporulation protein P|nr:stage sporulation protein [Clostridiaceae bacterium]
MNLRAKKKRNICISAIIASAVFIIFISGSVFAESGDAVKRGNMLYVQVVNYTMPLLKVTSFNDEVMLENNFSLKEKVLDVIGLNIADPGSIIEREIAFLGIGNGSIKLSEDNNSSKVLFNPFKLNESEISKNSSGDKADELNLKNTAVNVYNPKLKKTLNAAKPEVFIYHTHTTESFLPGDNDKLDPTQNICSVGELVKRELEENYGIAVIHDTTIHNVEDYYQSYNKSAVTVDKYLKQYKDFKLVIDMHRDSVPKEAATVKLNGENVAKFMFVMARKNPHYEKNISDVNKLMNISNKLFPGLCKGIYGQYNYGTRYFNQDKSNNAMLIEVGSDTNQLSEAQASAKYLARIIAEYINGTN